jgi:hypothetical protein
MEYHQPKNAQGAEWILGLTLGLLLVTALYTYFTFKMARIMERTYEIAHRPYISFENLQFEILVNEATNVAALQIAIILRNAGNVLAHFKMKSISITLGDRRIDNPVFNNSGGSIFPGSTTKFKYDTFHNFDLSAVPVSGEVRFQIEYGMLSDTLTHKSTKELSYDLLTLNPLYFKYTFLKEEDT